MSEADEKKSAPIERNQPDDAERRADGEAFDERMKEFVGDPPRPVRPSRERRRKR